MVESFLLVRQQKPVKSNQNEVAILSDSLDISFEEDTLEGDSVTPLEKLKIYLNKLDTISDLEHAKWGVSIIDIAADSELVGRHQRMSLVPASIMKVFTTGTALAMLGPDYNFPTTIMYDGEIDKVTRTLNGNIYIKGSGDPSLGSLTFPSNGQKSIFRRWVRDIKKLEIDSINGKIISDARIFDYNMVPTGWAWEDMQGEYGVGISGLSLRENICAMKLTQQGDSMKVTCNPLQPNLQIHNNVVSKKRQRHSAIYVSGAPYSSERFIWGTKSKKKKRLYVKSQIYDPPATCAYLLMKELTENGVGTSDSCTTVRALTETGKFKEYKGKQVSVTYSPPLLKLINHTNRVSQNFYAECFLKFLSANKGERGTTYDGAMTVRDFWKAKGINMHGFYMSDGSGLSRTNAFTPAQLTRMLALYKTDSTLQFDDLYNSLPIAGKTGTMKNLLKGTLAENNVHAKSGSMRRVKSYAGYVKDKKGKLYAFTLIANDFTCSNGHMRNHWLRIMRKLAELE